MLLNGTSLAAAAQEPQEQAAPPSGAPKQEEDPPAETVYKNIQLFKGMPVSRVDRIMDILNKFLGVECTHCHIQDQWEREDKEQKQIAREMFQMVGTIGREFPRTKKKVACWTCHRGSPKPESLPPSFQRPRPQSQEKQGE
ncbi:MAG: photosynthetic reaction center cytochrome c subunit family protein [Terriglobia bacterium]